MGELREKYKNMKKENVLIVGGAGYLGGYMTDLFVENGYNVTVYDNLLYEERFLKPVNFVYADSRDTDKLYDEILKNDIIIFLQSIVGDPACSQNTQIAEDVNYTAIKNICDKLLSKNIKKKIIFPSTCSVYGAQDGILNEESPTNPLSVYAATKLAAEKHINDLGGTIFRLGTVYGLGDTYSRIRMDLVVNVLTMKAIKYGVIGISGGNQWRPIISVIDIGNYFLEAAQRNDIKGTYCLAYENTTIKDLGEKVASLIPNTKIEYSEVSYLDARNYRVDNSKALSTFNYKPKVSVEDEVLRMKKMFEENRIINGEDKTYHNGLFLKNKKEQGINY